MAKIPDDFHIKISNRRNLLRWHRLQTQRENKRLEKIRITFHLPKFII